MLYNSRYNFQAPLSDGIGLYNTLSGALLKFKGQESTQLAELLCGRKVAFPENCLDALLQTALLKGGFLTPDTDEELKEINRRFLSARDHSPVVITVTTTMDCNLGCYYCYEERAEDKLEIRQIPDLLKVIRESLLRKNKKSLHIDWYGGEPMLNFDFLEQASFEIQQLCREMEVDYHASVISNGTVWPENLKKLIQDHKIRQVQISFDGLRRHHNKRRRYRKGYGSTDVAPSSFDQAVQLVDKLLELVRVDIRLNIDRKNLEDLDGFIDMAEKRGWFQKPFPAVIQPARLASFSEHSSFMRSYELSVEEYDRIRRAIKEKVGGKTLVEESEIPDGFPYPRNSVCAALAHDSVVVGADSQLYRCGLQVGEVNRAVSNLQSDDLFLELPVINPGIESPEAISDESWWNTFNPTQLENCSICSFLPICWGGCPKKHLETDQHALEEQSRYWRNNLPAQIAGKLNSDLAYPFQYSEEDQFRAGY